jgi:hypothetical protein
LAELRHEIPHTFANTTEWPANGLNVVTGANNEIYAVSATLSNDGLAWNVYRIQDDGVR